MTFLFLLLIIFICYWIVSMFFFFFPFHKNNFPFKNIIFKQVLVTPQKVVLDIAHRGGSQEAFENTIKAFKNARHAGINGLEMDVHLTKDKKLVVIHDTQMDRLCGTKGVVSDYDFASFPKYKNEIKLHFSANRTVKNHQAQDEQLCLLEFILKDVFKQFPNSLYNIELKDASDDGIRIFYETVTKYHIDDKIIWGTRNYPGTKKLKELAPHIPVFFSAEGVLKVFVCFYTGLLPFIPLHYDSLQVPLFTKEFFIWKKKDASTWIEYIGILIMFGIIKLLGLALPFIIQHLKKRGIITMLWVLNETEEFEQAIKCGAQGIMTDRPTLLKQYLVEKHLSID